MVLKTKNIDNIDFENLIKLFVTFDIKTTLKCDDYKKIIQFYDDNELVGFMNYVELSVIGQKKLYIKSIHSINDNYLDIIVKKMIKTLINKYYYLFADTNNELLTENIIKTLRENEFDGGENILFR